MKLSLAIAVLAFGASPALAQTSTCYRLGNVASCTVGPGMGDNPAERRYSGFQEVERLRDKNEEREEIRKEQGLREEVGSLIADGRCADAKKAALRGGDFALADRAGSMCKASQRQ